MGKGTAPPFGTELRPIPNAAIENVVSRTRTKQVKFDAWVLPFLNMFAAVGKVDGTVNLDVIADLDAALPPPICTPIAPCGTVSANFDAGVDAVTATIGATGVYSIGYWWTSATLSTTLTAGSNSDTDIKSYTGGACWSTVCIWRWSYSVTLFRRQLSGRRFRRRGSDQSQECVS